MAKKTKGKSAPAKAKKKLGWEPSYSLDDLVKDMMEADLRAISRDKVLVQNGMEVFNSEF